MNIYLRDFVRDNLPEPGSALDLGAGNFFDVACLRQLGWDAEGVDLNTGTDLENPYHSPVAPHDLVYSNYVIHKLVSRDRLVKSAFDNLKPGGWCFLLTFDESDPNSFSDLTADKLIELLESAGFENIKAVSHDFYDNEPKHQHWHKILEVAGQKPTERN